MGLVRPRIAQVPGHASKALPPDYSRGPERDLTASNLHSFVLELQQRVGNKAVTQLLGQAQGARTGRAGDAGELAQKAAGSPGRPLDAATRTEMESRFGYGMGQVRVHTDEQAAASALSLGARAYTVGQDIVFGEHHYAPGTSAGKRLLAHELAHVVQQRRGGPTPALDSGASHEADAAQAANAVVSGQSSVSVGGATGVGVAREEDPVAKELKRKLIEQGVLQPEGAGEGPTPTPSSKANPDEEALRQKLVAQGILQPQGAPGATANPPATSRPAPMTAAHAGGALGEREIAFALGERGFEFIIAPSGPGAHPLTGSGFDSVAYNPKTGEVWLIDNKATGGVGNIEGRKATALGKNLKASLEAATGAIRAMKEFPNKTAVLKKLDSALAAVRKGQPIPADSGVKLKVTNAGGFAGGARNLPKGAEFEDVVGSKVRNTRKADIAAAKKQGVPVGRPKSHVQTEARRERVGGMQTREPIVEPVAPTPGGISPKVKPVSPEPNPIAPKPATTESVAPNTAASKPGSKWAGTGKGLLGIAAPLVLGWFHGRAVEKRIKEQANKEGYVPPGSPSGEGRLYDLGSWLLDPMNDADKAVGIEDRFNFPVWRERVRSLANAKKPGESLRMTWSVGQCEADVFGSQVVKERAIVYRKQPDGRWTVESGDVSGIPDLNSVISPEVPDATIRGFMMSDPCQA